MTTGWVLAGTGADDATIGTYTWSNPSYITDANDANYAIATMYRGISDYSVKLLKGGAVSGDNKSTGTALPSTEATIDYGTTSDLWGVALTPADVNDSTFGVSYAAQDTPPIPPVQTHYLFATNFGFAIPVGETVLGVEARIKRKAVSGANAYVNDIWMRITYTGFIPKVIIF